MRSTATSASRAASSAAGAVHVSVILGGLYGPDGYVVSRGMVALADAIGRIPGVQVKIWTWDLFDQVYAYLSSLPKQTQRVLVGYSGGGSRITWIAKERPAQKIDLAIGYDPSPTWQMKPLAANVEKAICYHNLNPSFGNLGGGRFTGIANIETIDISEPHMSVQWDNTLHQRTLKTIAGLTQRPIPVARLNRLVGHAVLERAPPHFSNLEATAAAPAPNPVGSPEPFSTRPSTSHNHRGHSTTTGLRGTLQKYDDGSSVIEATEALSAFRVEPRMEGSLMAFCRRVQKDNVVTVQQGSYSYKGRQLPLSTLFLNIDGIPTEAPPGFEGTPVRTVKATQFGKNDTQDEGTGSPFMGLIQTNSEVFGGSVKVSVMQKVFGRQWTRNDKRLVAMIEIFFVRNRGQRRMVRVPLVDVGPAENAPSRAEVDLTWACDQFLGTQGGGRVQYRLLLPTTPPPAVSASRAISRRGRKTRARRPARRMTKSVRVR
jgi:hypothetical protein